MRPEKEPTHKRKANWKIRVAASAAILGSSIAGSGYWASEHPDKAADFSRSVVGDEMTARFESWKFKLEDEKNKLQAKTIGKKSIDFGEWHDLNPSQETTLSANTAPQAIEDFPYVSENFVAQIVEPEPEPVVEPPKPAPLALPEIKYIGVTKPGNGYWRAESLPRSDPDNPLMVAALLNPDVSRPYARVGALLIDSRYVKLHMVGGIEDPGGDRGIRGPGVIPAQDRKDLIAAWNGGFKGPHGGYGMIADGKVYRPMGRGWATVAVDDDGTIRMGQWGRDDIWHDNTVAARQNAVLLVDNCKVSPRTNEGNDTWGYVEVNSAQFITWRSAIGLTAEGNLIIAAGSNLSAKTLAESMQAFGACTAMQLDINTPYVLTSLFYPNADGSLKPIRFLDDMTDNPNRFMNSGQTRDFMYLTIKQ